MPRPPRIHSEDELSRVLASEQQRIEADRRRQQDHLQAKWMGRARTATLRYALGCADPRERPNPHRWRIGPDDPIGPLLTHHCCGSALVEELAKRIRHAGNVIRNDVEWLRQFESISVPDPEEQVDPLNRFALLLMRLAIREPTSEEDIQSHVRSFISPATEADDARRLVSAIARLASQMGSIKTNDRDRSVRHTDAPNCGQVVGESSDSNAGNALLDAAGETEADLDEERVYDWTFRPGEACFKGHEYVILTVAQLTLLRCLVQKNSRSVSHHRLTEVTGNDVMELTTLRSHICHLNKTLKTHFGLTANPITSTHGGYRLEMPSKPST